MGRFFRPSGDDHTIYAQRVRNYSAKPIEMETRRSLRGHVVFRSQLPVKTYRPGLG